MVAVRSGSVRNHFFTVFSQETDRFFLSSILTAVRIEAAKSC